MDIVCRFIIRRFFPGWLLLASCGSTERTACYAAADVWLVDQAAQCKARGFTWSACPERPRYLDEHMERQARCP